MSGEALARAAPSGIGRREPAWAIVAAKELGESLTSLRWLILLALLTLAGAAPVYVASGAIRDAAEGASGASAVFLALFTLGADPVPSFTALVGFLAPLLGIAFSFDAISAERAQGTLPRLLSQPIHRDDVINGKFAAGLGLIGMATLAVTLVVAGIGLFRLGIAPSLPEVLRLVIWLLLTIVYVGTWLAIGMLCSVVFRRAATAALVSLGVWLVLTVFGVLLARLLAGALAPVGDTSSFEDTVRNVQWEELLAAISPNSIYQAASAALLNPGVTAVGVGGMGQLIQLNQQLPSQLSLEQSLVLVLPQVIGLLAVTAAIFVLAYVTFLRQDIRG